MLVSFNSACYQWREVDGQQMNKNNQLKTALRMNILSERPAFPKCFANLFLYHSRLAVHLRPNQKLRFDYNSAKAML